MKNFFNLATTAAIAALSFTACSDDSSSTSANFRSETRQATIDEATSKINMYAKHNTEACVYENDAFAWKTNLDIIADTITYKYLFKGDTLVLQQCYYDSYDEKEECYSGSVLVGGKAGSVTGKWHTVNCRYNEDAIECNTERKFYYEIEFDISSNSIELSGDLTPMFDYYNSVELMESEFINETITCIFGSYSCYVSGYDIFYNDVEDVNETLKEYNVQVVSKSKRSAQLVVNDKTVNINVNEFAFNLDSEKANITVSAGEKSCNLNYNEVTSENVKQYCSIENKDYLETYTYTDVTGASVSIVDYYSKENQTEFRECLKGLISEKSDNAEPLVLFKESTAKQEIGEDIRETQKRLLNNVLNANK